MYNIFMKSFENLNSGEKQYDEYLLDLWKEYGFDGKPPFSGSKAEERLKEKCRQYSQFVINSKGDLKNYSDVTRRQLHNEIAVMTVGEQRSGMSESEAREIANFAMAYTHGITVDELETGKFDDVVFK